MFVRDFIHVDRPFHVVAPRFVGTELSVEACARHAISDACAAFCVERAQALVNGMHCRRGRLRSRGDAIVVPLRFVNDDQSVGLASLEGELEVAPVGSRTELGLEANYRRWTDDAVLLRDARRVIEVAVRGFLQELCRALED